MLTDYWLYSHHAANLLNMCIYQYKTIGSSTSCKLEPKQELLAADFHELYWFHRIDLALCLKHLVKLLHFITLMLCCTFSMFESGQHFKTSSNSRVGSFLPTFACKLTVVIHTEVSVHGARERSKGPILLFFFSWQFSKVLKQKLYYIIYIYIQIYMLANWDQIG